MIPGLMSVANPPRGQWMRNQGYPVFGCALRDLIPLSDPCRDRTYESETPSSETATHLNVVVFGGTK